MKDELYVGQCPICGQGRQIVRRTIVQDTYFLSCEDCESEWADPSRLSVEAAKPIGTFSRSELATREEMLEHPCKEFVKNLPDL
jgi:formate dehydrogenase maturation protein FdhE